MYSDGHLHPCIVIQSQVMSNYAHVEMDQDEIGFMQAVG